MTGTPDTGPSKESLAFRAIAKGDLPELQKLVGAGANIEAKNAMDETMLVYALQKGRDDAARFLIGQNAVINARGRDLKTPLMLSLTRSFNDVARILLDKGADKTLKDVTGATAQKLAKLHRNTAGLQLIYSRMTDAEAYTEALWAIRDDDLPTLKFLVESRGVKLSTPGPDGQILAHDMTLWNASSVQGYVMQMTAAETASVLGKGVGGNGVQAPEKAAFKKSRRPSFQP